MKKLVAILWSYGYIGEQFFLQLYLARWTPVWRISIKILQSHSLKVSVSIFSIWIFHFQVDIWEMFHLWPKETGLFDVWAFSGEINTILKKMVTCHLMVMVMVVMVMIMIVLTCYLSIFLTMRWISLGSSGRMGSDEERKTESGCGFGASWKEAIALQNFWTSNACSLFSWAEVCPLRARMSKYVDSVSKHKDSEALGLLGSRVEVVLLM